MGNKVMRSAKGQFLPGQSGNPGGMDSNKRRLNQRFVADVRMAWEKHGRQALEQLAMEDPEAFVRVAASFQPKASIEVDHQHQLGVAWVHALQSLPAIGEVKQREIPINSNAALMDESKDGKDT